MAPFVEFAVAFASALIDGHFARGESMLSPELRRRLSSDSLRERFYAMFRSYATGEPRGILLDEEFQLEDWPSKLSGDIGLAYVGIEGEDSVEGMSIVVAAVDGRLSIRQIEWGRP